MRIWNHALAIAALASVGLACSADGRPEAAGGAGSAAESGGSGGAHAGSGGSATAQAGKSAGGAGGKPSSAVGSGGSGGASSGGSGGSGGVGAGGSGGHNPDAGAGAGGEGDGPGAAETLEPARGALLGVFYGDDSIADTTAKLGRALPVHLTYYAWDDDWARGSESDLNAGRIPLVNWEPYSTTLDAILSGSFDAMLHERATDAQALGDAFFLDFAAEMNGDWSPWSGAENGMSADKYIATYRHIHDVLTADGATNIVWLWCPNVTDEPRSAWNETLAYYPGDAYVDWTCVDGYNWGSTDGGWQSFPQVFADVYEKLATKHKPIMIGEMASAEAGGDKAAWIDAIVPALRDDFPLIKGLVWFDIDKETDWRISSSPAAEAAFKKMAADPYFNP